MVIWCIRKTRLTLVFEVIVFTGLWWWVFLKKACPHSISPRLNRSSQLTHCVWAGSLFMRILRVTSDGEAARGLLVVWPSSTNAPLLQKEERRSVHWQCGWLCYSFLASQFFRAKRHASRLILQLGWVISLRSFLLFLWRPNVLSNQRVLISQEDLVILYFCISCHPSLKGKFGGKWISHMC